MNVQSPLVWLQNLSGSKVAIDVLFETSLEPLAASPEWGHVELAVNPIQQVSNALVRNSKADRPPLI